MIAIKIQCGCGQDYAFDVEPIDGRMPQNVACPSCGVDGTSAADEYIAQAIGEPQPALGVPAESARIRVGIAKTTVAESLATSPTTIAAPRNRTIYGKEVDLIQLTHEARAKMSWGDAPEEVTKFLMMGGMARDEAIQLTRALFLERAATIRKNGIGKIIVGTACLFVPAIAWVVFSWIRFIPMKLFGMAVLIGLWGVYQLLKGIIMFIAPKSEPGDVAEQ
jgi:hypothetical protein